MKQPDDSVSTTSLRRLAISDAKRQEQTELLKRMRAAFADISEEQIATDVAQVVAEIRQSQSPVA